MTDRDTTLRSARRWLDGYLTAWLSNDPDDIRALFTDDADYRTEPWLPPASGADAVVQMWLERKDDPDTFEFDGDVVGIDGATAFVKGETRYSSGTTYSNLWVIELAEDGRARSFTEWWMDHSNPS